MKKKANNFEVEYSCVSRNEKVIELKPTLQKINFTKDFGSFSAIGIIFSLSENEFKCKKHKFYEFKINKLTESVQILNINKEYISFEEWNDKIQCSLIDCITGIYLRSTFQYVTNYFNIDYSVYYIEYKENNVDKPIIISYLNSASKKFVLWICPYINWLKKESYAEFIPTINANKNSLVGTSKKHIWTIIEEKSLISSRFFICGHIKQQSQPKVFVAISISFDYQEKINFKNLEIKDNYIFKCDETNIFNPNKNDIVYSYNPYHDDYKNVDKESSYLTNNTLLYPGQMIILFEKRHNDEYFLKKISNTFERYYPIVYKSICKVPNIQATQRLMVGNKMLPNETINIKNSRNIIIYRISSKLPNTTTIRCQIVPDNFNDSKFLNFYSKRFNSSIYKKSTLYLKNTKKIKEQNVLNITSIILNEIYKCILNPPYLVNYIQQREFMIVSENFKAEMLMEKENETISPQKPDIISLNNNEDNMEFGLLKVVIVMIGIILLIIAIFIYNSYKKVSIFKRETSKSHSDSSSSTSLKESVTSKLNQKYSEEKKTNTHENDKKSDKKKKLKKNKRTK